ncbi:MalY/PatB family protein [Fuchsiella alkaliacetigena]|uniref:MalY/PatB family protein n=1 Tax=Fuchsiella alkaliacetigena TaxID=957042 RepID=UPI00200B97DE|nr:MalY/PatB family protein [Fuchsiella alkaliacetigena]MCK8824637.1 pyridoxal phosphate-dependent aminotransferase [Fuchsiella alkaliacetigena]
MYNFDELIERRNTDSLKWDKIKDEDMLPMWVADMDFKAPPAVVEALIERASHGIYGYAELQDSYYQAVIDWLERRYNWQVKQEWIFTSPGVVPALHILVRALTKPGDKVIIQSPVYYPFFEVVENNGRHVLNNTLVYDGKRYRMDYQELEKQLDSRVKLMILCNPHNPVGRVWAAEELRRLGKICVENGIVVIADEIHSDLVFAGHEHQVFTTLATEFKENSIVCNAASKTFNLAGVQTSNIIIPNPKLRTAFQHGLDQTGIERPNVFAITALKAAYNHGEQWLEDLLLYLQENLKFLLSYIQKNIPQVEIIEPEGTYLVWLDFRNLGLEDRELDSLLRNEAKLFLNPGHIFGAGGSGFQRLNIACPRSRLKEGLARLAEVINRY